MLGLKIRYKNAFSFVHRCNLYCFDHRISTRKALGESVIAVTPVGEFPHALEFNPSNNNIYVANIVSNSVSMIESMNNTVGGTVNVSSLPIALVFNPSNGGVYVGGTLAGTEGLVSVIG